MDAEKAARFIEKLGPAEISQGIGNPRAIEQRLQQVIRFIPGPQAQASIVQLLKDEQQRRRDNEAGRLARRANRIAWWAIGVSVASALGTIAATVLAAYALFGR